MQTDLSLNVRGFKVSTAQVRAALDKLHSRHALIADNAGMASELAAAGYTVVYRDFWPDPQRGDDDLHLHCTPAEYVAHMAGLGLHEAVWWHAGNEPTQEYARLIGWTLEAMKLAGAMGRRLVVGNFSVGAPEPGYWDTVLRPLLPALADGQHVLGLHEYLVLDYETSQPYYVGRFRAAHAAARAGGYTPPRTWITEGAAYDLVGSWQSMGLSAEALAADVGRSLREVYAPGGVEVVFGYSFGPWQNGQGWQFDLSPALDALAGIVGEGDMPIDLANTVAGTIAPTGDYASIRATPNGNKSGELRGVQHVRRTAESVNAGAYWWRFVTFDAPTAAMPNGWIADSEFVKWTPDPIVEPPPVEPPPVEPPQPSPDTLTHAQAVALLQSFEALFTAQREGWLDFEVHVGEMIDAQIATLGNAIGLCQETLAELAGQGEQEAA